MKKLILLSILIVAMGTATALAGVGSGAGYVWGDSNTISWIGGNWADISATGTQITSWTSGTADDGYATITLPFDFIYCGATYYAGSNLYIGSNGIVGFSSANMSTYSNTDIPNAATPNNMICVWWRDLCGTYSGSNLRWQVAGSAPYRYLVISYCTWYVYNHSTNPISFQIWLWEIDPSTPTGSNNSIWMQYMDTDCGDSAHNYGIDATVGLENSDGTQACKFSYNTASLSNGLGIGYWDESACYPAAFNLLTPYDGSVILVTPKSESGITTSKATLGANLVSTSKSDKATVPVTFDWEDSDYWISGDSVYYDLFIDNNSDFSSPEGEFDDIYGSTYTAYFSVDSDYTWYWRVFALENYWGLYVKCNNDFSFSFDYPPYTNIQPASLGHIKSMFH